MNIKKLALILISLLFLSDFLPALSAGRGRLRLTEVSPQEITLDSTNPEATLQFTVEGMIITPSFLAMMAMAGGVPVEVKLVPTDMSVDLTSLGITIEPASGLITFDRPSREFGVFETKLKLTSITSQRTIKNLVVQGNFSCDRTDGNTLLSENNIGMVGQDVRILCSGQGLPGETSIELGGSTGNTSIATVTPSLMSINLNPDGSFQNVEFTINVLMAGQTDVAFDFIGSMTFEVIPTFWNFQQGGGGEIMGGGGNTSTSSGGTSMTLFSIVVDDTIRPSGGIKKYVRSSCNLSPPIQDTAAFATCP